MKWNMKIYWVEHFGGLISLKKHSDMWRLVMATLVEKKEK